MDERVPSHAERRLIVAELIQREDVRARRQRFFKTVFVVGVAAAVAGGIASCLEHRSLWEAVAGLIWCSCMLLYTEFLTIPKTYMQDMDLRWHMNPWQDALSRLADDGRQVQGIVMLTIYPGLQLIAGFVYFALK